MTCRFFLFLLFVSVVVIPSAKSSSSARVDVFEQDVKRKTKKKEKKRRKNSIRGKRNESARTANVIEYKQCQGQACRMTGVRQAKISF
jgi:hypothetical protein